MTPRHPAPLSPLDDHSLTLLAEAVAERTTPKDNTLGRWIERAVGLLVAIAVAWMAMSENVATLKSRVDGHDQRFSETGEMLREMRGDIKTLLQRRP